ncbi:MAG: Fic family protein [Bryobacteraceae bacterium]
MAGPASHQLFRDADEKALLEARNGLLQFDEVVKLVDRKADFKLRPSTIQRLQRLAIQGIYTCAGNYRTGPVYIAGTTHEPPSAADVAELVEEMCEYVSVNWRSSSALHLAAYVMWRVNWIHPFTGGNGRTSRAVSYLVLCARLGYSIPGTSTIPDQIVSNRQPYYHALDDADDAWSRGRVDVSAMERLLSHMLAVQLSSVLHAAANPKALESNSDLKP